MHNDAADAPEERDRSRTAARTHVAVSWRRIARLSWCAGYPKRVVAMIEEEWDVEEKEVGGEKKYSRRGPKKKFKQASMRDKRITHWGNSDGRKRAQETGD